MRTWAGMLRMWTGKLVGGDMDTAMRRLGQCFACRGSRLMLVRGEIVDVDSARLRTVCGRFAPIANACSRTVVSVVRSRMRTVCWRAACRGLVVSVDCLRTWIISVHVLPWTCSRPWNCRVCDRERFISPAFSADAPRLLRGRGNLRHEGVTRALS